jgi:NAD(P)H-hydrate epimerase
MIGAPALAANAALRGGAGLVVMAVPENIQQSCAILSPCATSIPLQTSTAGELAPEALAELGRAAREADVICAGPGMSTGPDREQAVRLLLEQETPVVLDADGLNNLTAIDDWAALRKCPLVMTPHPGEFARLTGLSIPQIQSDREAVAQDFARQWYSRSPDAPLVLVLKGAGTIVTNGPKTFVNDKGNPGMATGGSGDVLTGLIAGLVCQTRTLFDASVLAVWLHSLAADLAAAELTEQSVTATDLIDYLPAAMKQAVG